MYGRINLGTIMTIGAEFNLFGTIRQRGKLYIAYCPPLDLTTQGSSIEEAKKNLIEACQLFIISCLERGTLDQALRELGFIPLSNPDKAGPVPRGAFSFPVPIPFALRPQQQCRA